MKKIFLLVFVAFLSGCAASVPVTKTIIDEVGGPENTKTLQCYLSRKVKLTLVEKERKSTIREGQLTRNKNTERATIRLRGGLMGVVRAGSKREDAAGFILDVAFEKYAGDPTLAFGQYGESGDAKYFILYRDAKNRVVNYGGRDYTVSYPAFFSFVEETEPAYLMIKMKSDSKKSSKSRSAKGLKIGE